MERRACVECGVIVRPGDGGIRAFGKLYCSEACADEAEDYTDYEYAVYDQGCGEGDFRPPGM